MANPFSPFFASTINDSPAPWKQAIDPAPNPDRLIEKLQHHLANLLSPQYFAADPPARRAYLIELICPAYLETSLLKQSRCNSDRENRPPMPQGLVQSSE